MAWLYPLLMAATETFRSVLVIAWRCFELPLVSGTHRLSAQYIPPFIQINVLIHLDSWARVGGFSDTGRFGASY